MGILNVKALQRIGRLLRLTYLRVPSKTLVIESVSEQKIDLGAYDTVMVDANVILKIIGYGGEPNKGLARVIRGNMAKLQIPEVVLDEVDRKVYSDAAMDPEKKTKLYADITGYFANMVEIEEDGEALAAAAGFQHKLASDPDLHAEYVTSWLNGKRMSLGLTKDQVESLTVEEKKAKLFELCSGVESDLKIYAQAAFLAKTRRVALISNDTDLQILKPIAPENLGIFWPTEIY